MQVLRIPITKLFKKTIRFMYYYKIGDIPLNSKTKSVVEVCPPTLKGGIHMLFLILATLIIITIAATMHLINIKEAQVNNEH